jgi:flagellar hook-length control protein FliK
LLQDETQSYDAFLKERILQLLRGSGILEPGRGSRAVDSQQPEVRQPGVLYDVSPKGNSGETDSSVNGSGPVFKDARVPVEAASGSAKPVEAREQVGSPEKRGGGETPQAGMNFSAINRHGGAGTPDHSPALHQPAGSGGGGTAATSHNPAGTVVQQETISPLQMPVLIGRVLRQAVARHIEGQTHLWFKLEPEHLGEVVVRLIYRHGDVSAHFLASNPAAGDAIESALPQLREALAAQNLHLQNASVAVGEEGGNPRPDYNTVHGKVVPAFDHGAANLEFKNARIPVEVIPQSTILEGIRDSGQVETPNTRGSVVSRQIAQDTISPPIMNRNDSAGTPGHNPAQYQSTNHSGDGITGTSHNLSNPIMQRENVNLLQMPVLIGRVLRQAVARHIEGQTHLWFKLEPEHLGEVVVRLVYRQGDVSAHFLAGSPAAGEAIESALPRLREALAAQNLHLQSASVSVGHEGGLTPRNDYQQPGYHYGRQHSGSGEGPGRSAGQEPPADPLPGGINLFV